MGQAFLASSFAIFNLSRLTVKTVRAIWYGALAMMA